MQNSSQIVVCPNCGGETEGACWKDDEIKRCRKCESYTRVLELQEEDQGSGGGAEVEPVDQV